MNTSIKTLFSSFNDSLLDDIDRHAIIQNVKADEVIIKSGQYIQHTVLVLSGKIKIYREDEQGAEFFMYHLQPGQACAISMICATKSQASAVMAKVVEDAELALIPLALMEKWMNQHQSWYEFVVETYRSRFDEVLTVIDNIAFKAMDQRLEFYLKRHGEAYNTTDVLLSHQEIANELNTSREVISRLLKKMEQRGLISMHRSHIEILF